MNRELFSHSRFREFPHHETGSLDGKIRGRETPEKRESGFK
jgi:hypothetical protein